MLVMAEVYQIVIVRPAIVCMTDYNDTLPRIMAYA
jgi:hypothetical protein